MVGTLKSKYCHIFGDTALLIDFSEYENHLDLVHLITAKLIIGHHAWLSDVVPGMDKVLIKIDFLDRDVSIFRFELMHQIEKLTLEIIAQETELESLNSSGKTQHIIQVCFNEEVAPDLSAVAKAAKLSIEEVIYCYKKNIYRVDILGFTPGFAYCSGLDSKLSLPRKLTPRPSVPAGSVAIAELLTAIYPKSISGGWNLIGRSANKLFDLTRNPPVLLMPGDLISIEEISLDQLHQQEKVNAKTSFSSPISESKNQLEIAIMQVIKPGALTSIQGAPRKGFAHWAISAGGAVDLNSLKIANTLVGNDPEEAGLEITAVGPTLYFDVPVVVSWVGGECNAIVNGREIKGNRPVFLPKNTTLHFRKLTLGFRITLAIAGGFDIPHVLGNQGSHLGAELGLPKLEKDDLVPLAKPVASKKLLEFLTAGQKPNEVFFPNWYAPSPISLSADLQIIHAIASTDLNQLPQEDQAAFWGTTWTISAQINRMGIRLDGDFQPRSNVAGIPSQGVFFGSIQFPPSKQPIILLSEHQTTGGYPLFANIISSDHAILAQLKPGDRIKLKLVSLEEADILNKIFNTKIKNTIDAIRNKLKDTQ